MDGIRDAGPMMRRAAIIPPMRPNVSPITSGPGSAGAGVTSSNVARTGSVMDTVNNTRVSVGSMILIVAVCILLFFVVYKVYDVIRKTSLRKIFIEKGTVSTTTSLDLAAGKAISDPIAGREYSISFWFWLDGSDVDSTEKNLISMGGRNYTFDIKNHLLVFKVATLPGSATAPVTAEVPIAIQKWTHIVMVVDNNYVTLYKDGDVVASHNVQGHLYTMPRSFEVGPMGTRKTAVGYIAGVRYFNHIANAKDVRTAYRSGPTSAGLLRYLGLPMYGVRNPFYRVDAVSDVKK